MAKSSGLGDNFYISAFDLSNDVNSLGTVSNATSPLEMTGIDKSAVERIIGQRSGTIEFVTYFNDTSSGRAHPVLSVLPTTDKIVSYFRGTTLGNSAASMTAKQINYDGTRAADGMLTFAVQAFSNGYGLEWGQMLTAGKRTDAVATAASSSTSIDTAASASFGGQAYLHVFAFSGTDVTIKIQDSADNASFSDVASFAFTTVTGTTQERIAIGNTATIRRYVSVATTTSGGFTSVQFAVNVVKNPTAGLVF